MMDKIAVIGGGYSEEREVSLRSADNVYQALKNSGYDVELIDMTSEPSREFLEPLKKYHLVLPILHGRGGEDGTLQKMLDDARIKYFGSGAEASRKAFNKQIAKEIFINTGIRVPNGEIVNKESIQDFLNTHKEFVLKPLNQGSSVGTLIVRNGDYDILKINEHIEEYGEMLAEELVKGVEITVAVLGDVALPPVAIFPPEDEEFDLDNKYNGKTREICPIPEDIVERKIQDRAMAIALKAHKSIGARHISRTDMIVTPENGPVVLEINTIPGLTSQSLLPKSAKAVGMNFDQLTERFVELSSGNNL
jgi:D-alanine-D-alanine ligase